MSANIFSLLKSTFGEASPLSRLGRWRQSISKTVDDLVAEDVQLNSNWLAPASGVTVGSNPLAGYVTAPLQTGAQVYVQNIRSSFTYDATSTATADQITVVQAVGTGRFVRNQVADVRWQAQTAWFVDPTSGFDENLGATSGAALKTWAELSRRVGSAWVVKADVTVQLLGNIPASDPVNATIYQQAGGFLRIKGVATQTYSGVVGAVTAINRATNTPYDFTDATLGVGHVNQRMRMTSGARNNYVAWLAKDLAGGKYRVTPWTLLNQAAANINFVPDAQGIVTVADTYVVESLTTVARMHLVYMTTDTTTAPNASTIVGLLTDIQYTGGTNGGVVVSGAPQLGIPSVVNYGCDMGSGQIQTSIASRHTNTTYAAAPQTSVSYFGSLLAGISAQTGCILFVDYDTLFQGGQCRLREGGAGRFGAVGFFDSPTSGVVVEDATLRSLNFLSGTDALYGAGNTAFGISVSTLGKHAYTAKPTVTGGTNDTSVGGTATAYGAIPFVNPTNLAQISVFA